MLVIGESAAEAIRGLIAGPEVPQGAGLRIVAQPAAGGENGGLELAVAAAPGEDDAVVEEQGAQVFLEPRAAELLDDKRLEADVEGDRVSFAVAQQAA